ncbi:antitoxin VbhA family protein [Rhodococcus sp. DMU1]|uniref:antitoxin VbhA family protein n=1 Tax=Rhodococcus sp. DMU1 TaxID=2722825 RepID=UPI00143E42DC|nr:antitoxin VbhA family protein [Rhodococcus sp. DMU1]QIX53972.1 antitoxin VbhA family protein [Rhodococcus sp. DMU1]
MAIRRPLDERTRRERAIRAARTTSELEGARSTEATRADQDAYVRGEIDIAQLGARVRARYNLA